MHLSCSLYPVSLSCNIIRGNSLETPNVWVLSTFHPKVWKQPPPPQCLTMSGGYTPTVLSRRAGSDVASASGQLLPWRPRCCQLCAIEPSGYSLHSLSNIGVEAAVSKPWGEKWTKPKRWGFPDYYPISLSTPLSLSLSL